MKTQSTALVRVLVEIALSECWGDDCTSGQVFEQAQRAALGAIGNLTNPLIAADLARQLRVVGEPEVVQIIRSRKP
jgi:hypothetical protein